MIAVIRWRRVGRGGPIRVLRWGLRPVAESRSGGVRMVMWIAVMAVTVWGRSSPVVEVAGGGAFDLAGAEPGTAGWEQGGQDGTPDGGQLGWAGRADTCCSGELVAGGF